MNCIKENIYKEPYIDNIYLENISGNESQFKFIDLYKVQVEDLDFISNFSFNINRKDTVLGVCVWWDVIFSHGNDPIVLSTSPFLPYTHWK